MSIHKRAWLITNDAGEKIDLTLPFSAEYVREAHLRFGAEFPMDGDDMRAWIAGARWL